MSSYDVDHAPVFRLAPGVLHADLFGETVLLDHMRGKYFGLKGSVLHVFEQLRDGASLDDLVGRLMQVCNVDAAEAAKDLTAVLAALESAGLVTRSPTP
jgi:hypothetical protein